METILISGGRPLYGSVAIHGSKNAALPVLTAAAAIPGCFQIENCPDIRDVHTTLRILSDLGAEVSLKNGTALLDTRALTPRPIRPELARAMRSSVLFLGALTARFGAAEVPAPGGCVLGSRPLDLHLSGLECLGVRTAADADTLRTASGPKGGQVLLRYPSVGATENLILAALGAREPVTILGAAREPEILCLTRFLTACGARIRGGGTGCIRLEPAALGSTVFPICPDRIETATYLCAAAACGGRIRLLGAGLEDVRQITDLLVRAGCEIRAGDGGLIIRSAGLRSPGPVTTGPHPAFPTDAQAPLMAALLRSEGTTVFHETVFENRYRHVPALRALGADIRVQGRIASLRGVDRLRGARMEGTDLRGTAAMVIGALGASGESRITCAGHLDRGYASLVPDLQALGAEIFAEGETARVDISRRDVYNEIPSAGANP